MLPHAKPAYTPQQLAYLGDAVWSLHVRCKYLLPPKNFASYRSASERHVNAAQQSTYLDSLLKSDWALTPAETELLGWAHSDRTTLKFRPKYSAASGQQEAYRKATAFEALIGHLSVEDPDRLQQLLAQLDPLLDVPPHEEQRRRGGNDRRPAR